MTLTVISLGAGVQSTTMALMAAHGEIAPMPDCAIFADTQAEPLGVYSHLIRLKEMLPFPVHTVTAGNLGADLRTGEQSPSTAGKGTRFVSAPFFIKRMKANGVSFEPGMGRRQCTKHYKIEVLKKKQRELLGYRPRQVIPPGSIEVWIGISLDEAIRARPAREPWQTYRHPLLELRMTRRDCLAWLEAHGYTVPPKSACTFCPYRNDAGWREMKENDPASFAEACEVDEAMRDKATFTNQLFVHSSLRPLREVDFATAEDRGQLNLFLNECEGMCGV